MDYVLLLSYMSIKVRKLREEKSKTADEEIEKILTSTQYLDLLKRQPINIPEELKKKTEKEKTNKAELKRLIHRFSGKVSFRDYHGNAPYYRLFSKVSLDYEDVESYLVCKICDEPIRKLAHNVSALKRHCRMHLEIGDCILSEETRQALNQKPQEHKEKLEQQKPKTTELKTLILNGSHRIKLMDMPIGMCYRHFYWQVCLDGENMRNYRVCKICKKPIRQLGHNVSGLGQHRNVHLKKGECTMDGLSKQEATNDNFLDIDAQLTQPPGIDI